jgi:Family of unknown function (DUF5706)
MTRMGTTWRCLAALLHMRERSASRNLPPAFVDPSSPNSTDLTTKYLVDLLEDTREELARADSKAALLLAATGVVVGALFAGLIGGKWSPFELDTRVEWMWWLGVAFAATGIFSIAAAVYPRIRRRGVPRPGAPTYFGDVAAFRDIEMFRQAIMQAANPQERLIDQTFLMSRIVQHKYVMLRIGLRFLLIAILACIAAVLVNIPLSR